MTEPQPQPQPREQRQAPQQSPSPQPPQHQSRTRNRLAADAQIPRRPRAVAGQRAAAKRDRQPVQRDRTGQPAEPVHDDPSAPVADPAAGQAPTPPDPAKNDESDESVETEPEPEPARDAAAPATPATPPVRPLRRAVVTAALALALLAVLAAGAVLTIQYRDATRTDQARSAAIAAAERAAPVIFSYDYRHLDQDFATAEALLTGPFHDQYATTTQKVVKPAALQYQGVVKAVVAKPADGGAPAVSVISASPDQVVVLAFINQSTTSTRVTGTQVDQNRVMLTFTHTPQGWLVSAVDAL